MRITPPKVIALALATAVCLPGISFAAQNVRVASSMALESQPVSQAKIIMREMNKRYPGLLDVKYYPRNQLGKERSLITQIQAGALEIVAVGSGPLKLDKKFGVFDIPWLFKDWNHVNRALKGKFGNEVRKLLEEKYNLVVIGVYGMAFRDIINKVRPIITPDDLKGLKIRETGTKYRLSGFTHMGANPVPLAWAEVFSALQTGVIDGVGATNAGFYEQKHYEVAKYLSLTNHVITPTFILASKTFMNKLTPEQQKTLREIGIAIHDEAFDTAARINEESLIALKKVIAVNQVKVDLFKERAAPVLDEFIKDVGDDWIKLINAVR